MAEHPNEALVRRGYEAFNKGDVETLAGILAEDVVQYQPGRSGIAGEYRGREATLAFYGQLAEQSGGTFRAELLEVYPNDRKAVAVHRATGERNGKRLDTKTALVFTIANGQAVELDACQEDEDAWDDFWS